LLIHSNISGIISKRLAEVFERILWRTFYGNVIINISDIDELFYNFETKEYEKRCVFSIFAHGIEMCKKIRKLANSLDLPLYDVESDLELRKQHLEVLKTRISDINTVNKILIFFFFHVSKFYIFICVYLYYLL